MTRTNRGTLPAFLASLALLATAAFSQPIPPPAPAKPKLLAPPADAPFADFSTAWPTRWGHKASDGIQGVIRPLDVPASDLSSRSVWQADLTPDADDHADAAALLADSGATPAFEKPGSFLVGRPRIDGAGGGVGGQLPGFDGGTVGGLLVFRFISGETAADNSVDLQRTTFVTYDPAALDPAAKPKGVILVMPGLFGTPGPVIEGTIARLRQSGFAILRMMSQPSRFTEKFTFHADVTDAATTAAAAKEISHILSDRAAECAFAAQAAWDYLESQRPDLKGLPCGVLGMSGGAMTLPTVVAREPSRYRACMMIAGGADFWLINEHSNYADWIGALTVDWSPSTPTDDQRKTLDLAYLAAAPLDSYHTAAALKGKHVVLMHAKQDRAVPAALGDVLWQRLGKPERWAGPWSHESVFIALAMQNDQVAAWFEKAMSHRSDMSDSAEPPPK
jgi:hypothetical protein